MQQVAALQPLDFAVADHCARSVAAVRRSGRRGSLGWRGIIFFPRSIFLIARRSSPKAAKPVRAKALYRLVVELSQRTFRRLGPRNVMLGEYSSSWLPAS